MIPVTQRVEGFPFGECVRASYASLLGRPIALIPRFDPGALSPGEDQRNREREWLSMIGFDLIEIPPASPEDVPPEALEGYHLISGVSPRGFGHRCVGLGGRVAWDPHPSRGGLTSVSSVGFLVPRC